MRTKFIIILAFIVCSLQAQYTDYRYDNQYCVVTDKSNDSIVVNEFIESGRVETAQNIIRADKLNNVENSALINAIPQLPYNGWLEKDKLYRYGDQVVQVIQSHQRTLFPPEQTPNLFSFYREDTGNLNWIANEKVDIGDIRIYDGQEYEVIQAHMTQDSWRPDLTLGILWIVHATTPDWTIGVAYKVGDIVTYQGNSYRCLQAHTSISTWNPVSTINVLWIRL